MRSSIPFFPLHPLRTQPNPLHLLQEIDAAEAQHAKLEMQADATRAERRRLESALEEVQLTCAAGQADLAALRKDLSALEHKANLLDMSTHQHVARP